MFADKTRKWNTAAVTNDVYEHANTGDIDADVDMAFDQVFDTTATVGPVSTSTVHQYGQPNPCGAPIIRPSQDAERERAFAELYKATFIAGNKAHGEFDRKRCEFNGLVLRNMATQKPGTTDLAKTIQSVVACGETHDAKFESIQARYQPGGKLNDDDINDVKVYSIDMYKLCKDGMSKRNALKSCLSAF